MKTYKTQINRLPDELTLEEEEIFESLMRQSCAKVDNNICHIRPGGFFSCMVMSFKCTDDEYETFKELVEKEFPGLCKFDVHPKFYE